VEDDCKEGSSEEGGEEGGGVGRGAVEGDDTAGGAVELLILEDVSKSSSISPSSTN